MKEVFILENSKLKWIILPLLCFMVFMATLDISIVNIALPTMAKDLSTDMSGISIVVTSYMVALCAIILIFGKLGDIFGKTKIFMIGVFVFTIGSAFCAFSDSLTLLIISRIFQAFGAAATMATNQGIISEIFPENKRGMALGLSGMAAAIGTMAGPSIGGFIISISHWSYVFVINIPIGIILFLLCLKFFPKKYGFKKKVPKKFSIRSTLAIFKNKVFVISLLCGLFAFTAMSGLNIIMPFYLQDCLNINAKNSGFILTLSPFIIAIIAPISGVLSDKVGSAKITAIGLFINAIGLFLISTLNLDSSVQLILVFIAVFAFGNAMFQSPNNSMVMSSVSKENLGIAGSLNALFRNIGLTTGVILSTNILNISMSLKSEQSIEQYSQNSNELFIFGMKCVFITLGLIISVGLILTLIRMRKIKK